MFYISLLLLSFGVSFFSFYLHDNWHGHVDGVLSLLGVFLGFLLTSFPKELERRTQNKALWRFLRQEINFCAEQATTYIEAKILAPAYRLPTKSYEISFPVLLKEGEITNEQDINKIMSFFDVANQMNRIMDILEKSLAENTNRETDEITLKEDDEFNRCLLKAEKIKRDSELYLAAILVTKNA